MFKYSKNYENLFEIELRFFGKNFIDQKYFFQNFE